MMQYPNFAGSSRAAARIGGKGFVAASPFCLCSGVSGVRAKIFFHFFSLFLKDFRSYSVFLWSIQLLQPIKPNDENQTD
jgi:hypothetical protein